MKDVIFYMEITYHDHDHDTKTGCSSYDYHHRYRYSSGPHGPFGWMTPPITSTT